MDAGHRSTRAFPSYTTRELREWMADETKDADLRRRAAEEVARRDAGAVSPVQGAAVMTRVNRKMVNTALAKALAYAECGKADQAEEWARLLVKLLECERILTPEAKS